MWIYATERSHALVFHEGHSSAAVHVPIDNFIPTYHSLHVCSHQALLCVKHAACRVPLVDFLNILPQWRQESVYPYANSHLYVTVCMDVWMGNYTFPTRNPAYECTGGVVVYNYVISHTHTHTHTHTHSTAPPKRPLADFSAIPTMHGNPNFQRGTPSRSTYAYGTRRPTPTTIQHNFYVPMGGNSQPTPTHGSSGFFKRLIPSRFSRGK